MKTLTLGFYMRLRRIILSTEKPRKRSIVMTENKPGTFAARMKSWKEDLKLFNLLVCGTGIITILLSGYFFLFQNQFIYSFIWIVLANLCFLAGLLIGIVINSAEGQNIFVRFQSVYFWVVSIFWALATIVLTTLAPFLL